MRPLALLLVFLLLAACARQASQLPPPPAPDQRVMPVAETNGTVAVDTGQPADAKAALRALFDKGKAGAFTVTYAVDSPATGKSSFTLYAAGDKVRTDASGIVNGTRVETRSYLLAQEMVACTDEQGWHCLSFPAAGEQQSDAFLENATVYPAASRRIAGAVASCFSVAFPVPEQGTVTEEVCYSPEGVPLRIAMDTPEGTFSQEATSYSTSVPAGAFTPPAEPQLMDMNAS